MNVPSLVRFFRQQVLYIVISAVIGAIFWASGQPINFATILTYSLCIGNLLNPAIYRLEFLYSDRPFPYNWLIFLLVLLALTVPVYLITAVVVWLIAPPVPETLSHLMRTGWRFPFLVTFVFGFLSFLYHTTKERLVRRNVELQQSVDRGTAQLEMQEQELERAREIQQSLLPKNIPQLSGFEVAGAWQPARSVSGDYYDVLSLGDHRLGICIADVVGKGVSAALLMANVQAAVRAFASSSESPAQVCGKVNRLLCENIARGKFVTFLYGILDGDARTFQYCNAGHLYPILASGGSVRTLEQGGAVLGVFPAWTYEDSKIELKAGDRLLLFTDGITEASDANDQEFDETRIASFAKANSALSASELNSRLLAQVTAFCGAQFRDDATLLVIAAN
ncbi:MAG TPA: PP2C family protein-serine/threonine phosphatase [Terracidiphilus sp.]|nr:PP2C family protein-serine/threonine phosphatase [Terracidiphilus sp.]